MRVGILFALLEIGCWIGVNDTPLGGVIRDWRSHSQIAYTLARILLILSARISLSVDPNLG